MKKITLANGLVLIIDKKPTESVTIMITVKAGSNNEPKNLLGISHFIEHMLFEGTKKRNSPTLIANEIEKLGGDLNAYTSNERTSFYIKVPKKHFDIALDIISDILQNPLFDANAIEKERQIILKEINMINDEPRFYQWILFHRILFSKHPMRNPVYGTKKTVRKITRKDLINYYDKYFIPNNMIISVVGNINNVEKNVKNAFKTAKKRFLPKHKKIIETKQNKINKIIEKRKTFNSYIVLGYISPNRSAKESYALDVVKAHLARGQSGRIIEEIRNKRGLAYEVNILHEPTKELGIFAVYLNTDKRNINTIINIILDEFEKINKITSKEIKEAKGFLSGQHILENEDTRNLAEDLNFWQSVNDANLSKKYLRNIKSITKKDIIKAAKKYLTKNYSLAIIEQATT